MNKHSESIWIVNERIYLTNSYDRMAYLMTFFLDPLIRQQFCRLLTKIYKSNNVKICIDIGCGSGLMTKHVLTFLNCNYVILFDISKIALKLAKRRFNSEKFDYICASIEYPPLKHNSIDLIYSAYTLRQVNLLRSLLNMYSIVRKNGVIAILDFWNPISKLVKILLLIHIMFIVPFQSLIAAPRNFKDYAQVYKTLLNIGDSIWLFKILRRLFRNVKFFTYLKSIFVMIFVFK